MKLFYFVLLRVILSPVSAQERDCGMPIEDCKSPPLSTYTQKLKETFGDTLNSYEDCVPKLHSLLQQTPTLEFPIDVDPQLLSSVKRIVAKFESNELLWTTILADLDITELCVLNAFGVSEEMLPCWKEKEIIEQTRIQPQIDIINNQVDDVKYIQQNCSDGVNMPNNRLDFCLFYAPKKARSSGGFFGIPKQYWEIIRKCKGDLWDSLTSVKKRLLKAGLSRKFTNVFDMLNSDKATVQQQLSSYKDVTMEAELKLNNLRENQKRIALLSCDLKGAYVHIGLLHGKLKVMYGTLDNTFIWNTQNINRSMTELAELIETGKTDKFVSWLYVKA